MIDAKSTSLPASLAPLVEEPFAVVFALAVAELAVEVASVLVVLAGLDPADDMASLPLPPSRRPAWKPLRKASWSVLFIAVRSEQREPVPLEVEDVLLASCALAKPIPTSNVAAEAASM